VRRVAALALLLCCGPACAQDLQARSDAASVAAASVAKIMCSGLFVSGLAEAQVRAGDLAGLPPLTVQIDRGNMRVTAVAAGSRRVATHQPGMGCVLAIPGTPDLPPRTSPKAYPQIREADPGHPMPLRQAPVRALEPVLQRAFDEPDAQRARRTRAVLVVRGGLLVAERYADGIDADTPLAGYSMAKGVANLIVGQLVAQGLARPQQDGLRPEWLLDAQDGRRNITLDQLLRMTSGLQWSESYLGTTADVMVMLTSVASPGGYAAAKPLRSEQGGPARPGAAWQYSSGDYAIAAEVIGDLLRRRGDDPLAFPYEQLFRRLGMTSAILEATPDGHQFLSSFMYATARDWARLGLFMLDEARGGNRWPGLLPRDWMTQSLRPAAGPGLRPGAAMGSGVWTRLSPDGGPQDDSFFLAGYRGQFLIVVPSQDIVVVRLGNASFEGLALARELLADVAAAVEGRHAP
jgi:CubicO group peptidase (beta-lactamase class C family)